MVATKEDSEVSDLNTMDKLVQPQTKMGGNRQGPELRGDLELNVRCFWDAEKRFKEQLCVCVYSFEEWNELQMQVYMAASFCGAPKAITVLLLQGKIKSKKKKELN